MDDADDDVHGNDEGWGITAFPVLWSLKILT